MDITVRRKSLAEAFSIAASVAPKRSPKEVLQNVLVSLDTESHLTLCASDMDTGIKLSVPESEITDVRESGQVLIPVIRGSAILRDSDAEEIRIKSTDSGSVLTGGRSRFQMASADPNDFPRINIEHPETYHQVPCRMLAEMIRRTIFVADDQSSRYTLGGIFLEWEGEQLATVATDGKRLAVVRGTGQEVGEHQVTSFTPIVPKKSAQLILSSLPSTGDAKVRVTSNHVEVVTDSCMILARLLDGRFPAWQQVVPDLEQYSRLNIVAGVLDNAVRQASVMTDHESRGITFTVDSGELSLASSTQYIGESSVSITVNDTGEPSSFELDYRWLSELFRVLEPETPIELLVPGPSNKHGAVVVRCGEDYQYVIMPMSRDR